MSEAQRFASYENSFTIYRTKSAMALGVLYFNKGYATTPVLAMQLAEVNEDGGGDQKTFNWETEVRIWWFRSYDGIYEFYKKLGKWKQILTLAKQNNITDSNELSEKYKEFAEKNKISNPMKKKSIFMNIRYYNTYFFSITLASPNLPNKSLTVSLYEDELDMLIQYVGDFLKNYHMLVLTHRMMSIARGYDKTADNSHNSEGSSSGAPQQRPQQSNPRPQQTSQNSKPKDDPVQGLLDDAYLDNVIKNADSGNDIPF